MRTYADFAAKRRGVDAQLLSAGEQAISKAEFYALRLYTGPVRLSF